MCIKNAMLYKEGDSNKYLYFVRSGEFQITKKVLMPRLDEEVDEFQRLFDDPGNGRDK